MLKMMAVATTIGVSYLNVLSVGKQEVLYQTHSSLGLSLFSPTIYWLCAIALMLLTCFMMMKIIQQGANKKLVLAIGFILILMFGNSAFYLQNQLPKPITVPLVHDFYSGNETHDFTIRYLTNKSDHRSVKYLQAGEVTLFAQYNEQPANYQRMFYFPTDVTDQGRYQLLRSAHFIGNKEEMIKIINSDAIYLVLDDGEKLSTNLQLDFNRPTSEVAYDFISSSVSSNGNQSGAFMMMQDAVFDEVFIPEILQGSVDFKEMNVNGKTYTVKDFPVVVKKGQRVSLSLQSNAIGIDVQMIVGISGAQGILPIWIHRKAPFDIQKIKEESLLHD
ncbi:hypothetical protein ACQKNX_02675 [Lysinibacillus sp. NPDC093712]|uniref:hypothetical protein n=1 Tax=Lysinibacillus sp. NPDC093712 TaxID=3390579 RepID=UPI003CFF5588